MSTPDEIESEAEAHYVAREASPAFNVNILRGLLFSVLPRDDDALLAAAAKALSIVDQAVDDLDTLLPVGRMYLDAVDADPELEMVTLPEAIALTAVREAVARGEAS